MATKMKDNKDFYFQGQYSHELVLAFFRHHWILVLPPLITILFFIVLSFGLLIVLPSIAKEQSLIAYLPLLTVGLILLISLLIHALFILGIRHFLNLIIVTNLRIVEVKKSIFLKDFQGSLLLVDIQDVKRDQNSFWKNILDYGDLLITLQSREEILQHVPNPNYHFRLINQAKQEYQEATESSPEIPIERKHY